MMEVFSVDNVSCSSVSVAISIDKALSVYHISPFSGNHIPLANFARLSAIRDNSSNFSSFSCLHFCKIRK